MVIGFKKQFVRPIMAGTKKHTIREDKTNRWKAAMGIHMAVGVRTKNYYNFLWQQCISVQPIIIKRFNEVEFNVKIGERWLDSMEIEQLAINDGFDCLEDFMDWFNKDFTGKIIHWTNLKY